MNVFFIYFFTDNNESCESLWNRVCVKEPDGLREEALLSLSVFAIKLLKRLPDGSKRKRWLPGWFESLMILAALLLQRLR